MLSSRLAHLYLGSLLAGGAALASLGGCSAVDSITGGGHKSSSPTPAAPPATLDPTGVMPAGMTPALLVDLPEGESYLTNLSTLVTAMNLNPFYAAGHHGQNVTIAILDNGFSGLTNSLGNRLPPDTQLLTPALNQMQDTTHGTKLAEIVYALATGKASYDATIAGPHIILCNTDGFTNLQSAVQQVIAAKADIVLYAQVWQYGGNFDGQGFINAAVNQATQAGVLWLNAAGNLGQTTFNGPVTIAADNKTVALPYQSQYVRFTVALDQTPVTIALNWNDYQNTTAFATAQDLDLVLEDKDHKQLNASRLNQSGTGGSTTSNPNYSAYPRELIQTTLNAGSYYLRVEAISHNFTAASQIRLSIDGDSVDMLDSSGGNTVGIPGDNASVITIGANDVNYSGTMPAVNGGKAKPEVQVASYVAFSDGEHHYGTSSASAIVAGALVVFEGVYGKLTRAQFMQMLSSGVIADPSTLSQTSPNFKLATPTTGN